jgi:hypothetical protein
VTASLWFAAGKHPCTRDFFRLGQEFPLAVGLAGWVEAGYESGTAETAEKRSWRFWAAAAGMLCYGVLGDSRDALGRPFPLLVAGQDRSAWWQPGWQEIPTALDRSWSAMEGVAAADCPDLATLRTRICWEGAQAGVEHPSPAPLPESDLPPLSFEQDRERVSLSCPAGEKVDGELVAAAHAALKRRVGIVPSSVFMGGLSEAPRIIFFYRPLATRDFSFLWGDGRGAGDGAT